jgi:tRNA modification GTPase
MGEGRTWLAVLTPRGRGAVATVAVRGPRAVEVVGRRLRAAAGRPLTEFAAGRVVVGRFQAAGDAAEELVVGVVGSEEVEVHCHGGVAAVEAVAAALAAEGAERIERHQWVNFAQPDAIAAEAAVELASARTERTAAILLDQQRGALAREAVRIALISESDTHGAASALKTLLARTVLGRHLTEPWRLALVGRPNAGKSSLMNAILGYQRSIVYGEPGTTRDVLTASTAIDGWPVELADTAGLRASGDAIEAEGVERARQEMAAADLVLLVSDVTADWSDQERVVLQSVAQVLIVHNKCDLAGVPIDGRPAGVAVSALTGEGLADLLGAIAGRVVPSPPAAGAAVPFTKRQVQLLNEVLVAINRGDSDSAGKLLTRLTSSNSSSQ